MQAGAQLLCWDFFWWQPGILWSCLQCDWLIYYFRFGEVWWFTFCFTDQHSLDFNAGAVWRGNMRPFYQLVLCNFSRNITVKRQLSDAKKRGCPLQPVLVSLIYWVSVCQGQSLDNVSKLVWWSNHRDLMGFTHIRWDRTIYSCHIYRAIAINKYVVPPVRSCFTTCITVYNYI